jgi:WD40 repeat protein
VMDGTGADLPGWPLKLAGLTGGSVAVGDIDNDGDREIVVSVRGAAQTIAFHHDATQLWLKWFAQNQFFTPSPALADLTGDGKLETVLPSSTGRLYVITPTGGDLPGWPVYYSNTTYTESSPIVADVSGDGNPDILLGDEDRYINGWDAGGNLLDGFPLATQDAVRGVPVAIDLDGDGDVEVIVAGYDRTVYTWNFNEPYSKAASPWSEFHANSHRNGSYGYEVPTGIEDRKQLPVTRAGLEQNFPNPFNPVTTIVFHVPADRAGWVSLVVYDVSGARVKTIQNGPVSAGRQTRRWDGTDNHGNRVSSGVYFYRLEMPGLVDTRKMVLLK